MLTRAQFLVVAWLLLVATSASAQKPCPADCNASGAVTASDITRVNSLMFRCNPWDGGFPGGSAAGCENLAGGCPAADLNGDGCVRASEWGFILREISRPIPDPTNSSGCQIDPSKYPKR